MGSTTPLDQAAPSWLILARSPSADLQATGAPASPLAMAALYEMALVSKNSSGEAFGNKMRKAMQENAVKHLIRRELKKQLQHVLTCCRPYPQIKDTPEVPGFVLEGSVQGSSFSCFRRC